MWLVDALPALPCSPRWGDRAVRWDVVVVVLALGMSIREVLVGRVSCRLSCPSGCLRRVVHCSYHMGNWQG